MKEVEDPERGRKVRVRYAPSPTGVPHIGNIRTALFNYLFAKKENGNFILRIEDTDRRRSTIEHVDKIKESLEVLGLNWDSEYLQSQRLAIYRQHLEILAKKRLTYQEEGAWRFKANTDKNQISWNDLVHGQVGFPAKIIEDFIIIKSDGFPTYHLASVVDDHEMKITHVMRGDEWISSTPKHLLLYQAFGWQPPSFAHLPPILGPSHKKLSKRDGAKSVLEYIDEGYLPQALINFLALLGWAPKGDQEIFALADLIHEFSVTRINKNSPIFNIEKLNWFNKKYLQKLSTEELVEKIKKFPGTTLKMSGNEKRLTNVISLVRDRLVTLADFDQVASIFFTKGKLEPPSKSKIQNAKKAILSVGTWDEQSITQRLNNWITVNKLDPADFKNTLRLAVFADNTPPIYQSLAVLTKEEVIVRINDAVKKAK
ncbi:glutamate--tRNA ligase [Candidatus Curtissbacteria bacterium RIFCSPLOWO2_01_FULL_41_18]|uniref:Glutamate--tRNA ligase n=2 Tax=Candidatus Curtissiibacteriota TaxID=1752717 RepID=A0A1F5G2M5_9BACT|nr:MAG: glutamate--tRNA ligase [Candidatus Curtissbacteria bacterium RIFCSPHIGHO2_01_FULL_41_13]OGE04159.1 MAG: glutamate--tRNA ligase [Candidatus Curtissbacteria bacterium RIFCSPLOWO2_01_FULL_41_18]